MSGKTLAAAAAAAGMSERTAGPWQHGALPSTAKAPRSWGTREDPFAAVWQSEVVPQLVADTDGRLQVLTLFKALCRRHPGRFQGLGAAVRIEDFEDFGTTTNGKVSGRVGFVRGSVSTGFRAPTPGQQNGLNIHSWFDPTVGDLVNNAVIPSISPVARLRGGAPLEPEESIN